MTISTDPIGNLVLLCRAAAEAGEEWRARLGREWIPRLVAELSPGELEAALREWGPNTEIGASAAEIESAVVEAMAEDGYL